MSQLAQGFLGGPQKREERLHSIFLIEAESDTRWHETGVIRFFD